MIYLYICISYQELDIVNISTPESVIKIVCSNCADRLSSIETAVQLSLQMRILGEPSVIIGSEIEKPRSIQRTHTH